MTAFLDLVEGQLGRGGRDSRRDASQSHENSYDVIIRGKRTRYLKSLARKAEHVEFWHSLEELRESVLQHALVGL